LLHKGGKSIKKGGGSIFLTRKREKKIFKKRRWWPLHWRHKGGKYKQDPYWGGGRSSTLNVFQKGGQGKVGGAGAEKRWGGGENVFARRKIFLLPTSG